MKTLRDQWQPIRLPVAMLTISIVCGTAAANPTASAAPMPRCATESTDANGWASAFAARVQAYDGLFQYVVRTNGPPTRCSAHGLMYFDEKPFGTLRFAWRAGLTFDVTSMPPESSEITLRNPAGFPDQKKLIVYLRDYIKERGIPISFDRSETRPFPKGTATVFESIEPGANASVRLETDTKGRLVGIVLLLAL